MAESLGFGFCVTLWGAYYRKLNPGSQSFGATSAESITLGSVNS